MALLHIDFFSHALGEAVGVDVLLPEHPQYPAPETVPARYPVLYLLHGLSDDQTAWQRYTRIDIYAHDLIVVMPTTHRAWYTNTTAGLRYFDFTAYELPAVIRAYFPAAEGRENTFAAGNSMGGYGAFKLALSCPEQFGAAASLSGALDLADTAKWCAGDGLGREYLSVFGEPGNMADSENDILALAQRVIDTGAPRPKLYSVCGTEDSLLPDSRLFRDRFGTSFDLTYREAPGEHNWDFWDLHIRDVLDWLPVRGK